VSRGAGEPYRDKLLPLPPFLIAHIAATPAEIRQGLALTGFFLAREVFAPEGRDLPPARQRLVDRLEQAATISGARP
jgi:DNA repair protein RecO (recombination protein O)